VSFLRMVDLIDQLAARRGIALPAEQRNVIDNSRRAMSEFLAEERKELLGEPFSHDYRDRFRSFYVEFFKFAAAVRSALTTADGVPPPDPSSSRR
jgi:hypothetical protein